MNRPETLPMISYSESTISVPVARDLPYRRSLRTRAPAVVHGGPSLRVSRGADDLRSPAALTRDALALVMAGGRGTRLRQLVARRAKPAVPFGGKFRIVDFTLSNCINSGIRQVGVLLQYEGHSLIRHLQQGWGFCRGHFGEFVEPLPAEQRQMAPDWYAGTADAVYQNIDFIREHRPRHVLVLAGDHIYKMDYGRMVAQHVVTGAAVTVGCVEVPREQASDFGVMQVDRSNRVLSFAEKPEHPEPMPGKPGTALASMGIYVFETEFLIEALLRDTHDRTSSHDFGHDVVPAMIRQGGVYGYRYHDLYDTARSGYWRDVGNVDAYWNANLELTEVLPEFNMYDEAWPIWTHQLQVPPAKFVFDRNGQRGSAVDSLISGGCIVAGAEVRRSVMSVRASAEAGSLIEQSLLLPGVRVGRRCRIRKAVIDEGCVLPDGTVIGENAEIDAQRFHVTAAGVTLVTPDMLAADALTR